MSNAEFVEIGKYRILGQIGEGAMGVVYRAQDLVLNRPVAIKVMNDTVARDTDLRARFLREAQSAGSLSHPNVVTVFDFGEVNGHLFIAMELVEGTDLIQILKEQRPMTVVQKIDVLIDLLNGLAYAHKRGIVHRDVKPANIRIDDEGRARIMDFGIAHLSSSNMTRTGTTVGTPAYMSPEQITGGTITAASDIFSAGTVMYEIFTGAQAFGGETLQTVLYKIISAPVPPLTLDPSALPSDQLQSVSQALVAIIERALQKDPDARYSSALEMAAALSDVRAHVVTGRGLAGPSSLRATVELAFASSEHKAEQTRKRRLIVAVSGAAAVIVVAGGIGYALASGPSATQAADSSAGVAPQSGVAASSPSSEPTTPAVPTSNTADPKPNPASVANSPSRSGEQPRSMESASGVNARRGATDNPVSPTRDREADSGTSRAQTNAPPPPVNTEPPKATVIATPAQSTPLSQATPQPAASAIPSNASDAIKIVVAAYADALQSRDLDGVRKAYPGLSSSAAKSWEGLFGSVRALRVDWSLEDLNVAGQTATGTFVATMVPTYRDSRTKNEPIPMTTTMTFRKDGSAWVLTAVR